MTMLEADFGPLDADSDVYNALLKAKVAVEGVALRVTARAALTHPLALALLGVSLALGVTLLFLPALRPWSGRAVWVILLGVIAYGAAATIVSQSRTELSAAELRRLRTIRQGIAALLTERQASHTAREDPVLTRTISEAIDRLDDQIIPAMEQLVERQQTLKKHLSRYGRGDLPAPEPGVLERLEALQRRQQVAIDECVQQAANAYATLVALLQEGDDASLALRARSWADDLLTLYDTLTDVLHHTDDLSSQIATVDEPPEAHGATASEAELLPVTADDQKTNAASAVEQLVPLVEWALRRVNDPAKLTSCGLIDRLPWTLSDARGLSQNGNHARATPLEQARALRTVLIGAVERMKPADVLSGRGPGDMLRYHVLAGGYLQGLSTRQVMTRYGISESTLHRYRREGVRVLARELIEQEALLSRDVPDVASR